MTYVSQFGPNGLQISLVALGTRPSSCWVTILVISLSLPSVTMLEATLRTIRSSKRRGIEPGSPAGSLTQLDEGLADVVRVPAAFGVLTGDRPVARLALDQATKDEGTSGSAGMGDLRCEGAQEVVHPTELGPGYNTWERLVHAYGIGLVLGVRAPEQCACVRLVGEDCVDAGLTPEISPGTGDALFIESAGDVQQPISALSQLEDALDYWGRSLFGFQLGRCLAPSFTMTFR